jgi:hypothetical protein
VAHAASMTREPVSGHGGMSVVQLRQAVPLAVVLLATGCAGAPTAAGEHSATRPETGAIPSGGTAEYRASLAYSRCMRAHGVTQPDPDRRGDIHLTPAEERRMRRVGRAKVEAVTELCFDRHLKGVVDTRPLSRQAKARAITVLGQVGRCMRTYGYAMGRPVVRDLSLGRAFFGFEGGVSGSPAERRRMVVVEHICERRVGLAEKLDAIIALDRAPT